ncbi:helix-turn-helix transcriptional regulator [Actinoplanes sp. NPDC026623]|uniref:helix-turn-helix domain-containing protein n=1 Tax=Actinoplanes sp. NPDC026623 TaxID=3155610 RepID=UPI0033E90F5C
MDEMAVRKPPTVRLRRLAHEMTRAREGAGLTREQAAERVRMDPSSLWRLETAKNRPLKRTVLVLLDLYGITKTEDQARYLELLAKSNELGWLESYEDSLAESYQAYIHFEAGASEFRSFQNAFVPGLLQTPEYARAVVRGVHPTLDEAIVEQRAEVRARRQDTLAQRGVTLWMAIDEAVMHRTVGGQEVMRAQMQVLVDAVESKRAVVQIVPFSAGAHPGSQGAFTVLDFPAPDPALVYIEALASNLFIEEPDEVRAYQANFLHLVALSLSPSESLKMIKSATKA